LCQVPRERSLGRFGHCGFWVLACIAMQCRLIKVFTIVNVFTGVARKGDVMIALKTLSPEAVPSALQKARQYRLLNEPHEAESICLDILEVMPDHQDALITLLLALTDNFSNELPRSFQQALETVKKVRDPYCKAYYVGIIYERRAKAHLKIGDPGSGTMAHGWLTKAMEAYDQALKSCGPNQDAILRWNSCARIINTQADVKPGQDYDPEMFLDSFDMPY